MKNLKLSFFIDSIDSGDLLLKIKNYFSKKYTIDDTIIFSKDPLVSKIPKDFGILSIYHLTFYKDIIVFFSLEDYQAYNNISLSSHTYLFINNNTIQDLESVNRAILQNINMITLDANDQISSIDIPKNL